MSKLMNDLRVRRDKERAYLESVDPNCTQRVGFSQPAIYSSPEYMANRYEYAVETATRVAMSTIVLTAREVGWEKYCEAMEKIQFPSVHNRAVQMRKDFHLEGDTILDNKMHTLVWSTGCGFVCGANNQFSEDHMEGYNYWCPQVAALEYMGLSDVCKRDTADNMGIWCDAFDGLIQEACNNKISYTHAFCLHYDKFCRQIHDKIDYDVVRSDYTGVDNSRVANERKPGDESLYQTIVRQKEEKRQHHTVTPPLDVISWRNTPHLSSMPKDVKAARGCETKWHIATDALLLAGELLGYERFLDMVDKYERPGFEHSAVDKRKEFKLVKDSIHNAAVLMFCDYQGLPYTHVVTRYDPEEIWGYAPTCPLAHAAKEMGLDDLPDLSLWCDWYKNIEIHTVNPNINVTHTHCIAHGDPFCRFIIR